MPPSCPNWTWVLILSWRIRQWISMGKWSWRRRSRIADGKCRREMRVHRKNTRTMHTPTIKERTTTWNKREDPRRTWSSTLTNLSPTTRISLIRMKFLISNRIRIIQRGWKAKSKIIICNLSMTRFRYLAMDNFTCSLKKTPRPRTSSKRRNCSKMLSRLVTSTNHTFPAPIWTRVARLRKKVIAPRETTYLWTAITKCHSSSKADPCNSISSAQCATPLLLHHTNQLHLLTITATQSGHPNFAWVQSKPSISAWASWTAIPKSAAMTKTSSPCVSKIWISLPTSTSRSLERRVTITWAIEIAKRMAHIWGRSSTRSRQKSSKEVR